MPNCRVCGKNAYSDYCMAHKPRKSMKRSSLRTQGKKARKWAKTRSEYLKDKKNHEGYYVCESCGGWFKSIDVDHIKKRSVRPDLVFDEENLQTICRMCHMDKDG